MIINLVVLVAACSFAQNDDQLSRATLRGIKGVRVGVFAVVVPGPRNEQLQSSVELKLRMAGIRVLTNEEQAKEPGEPFLYVNLFSQMKPNFISGSPLHTVDIEVELYQKVSLMRDPFVRFSQELGLFNGS